MKDIYKICISILIIFLIFDFIMLGFINNSLYKDNFYKINNGPYQFGYNKILYAIITYLLMTIALYYFVIKDKKSIYTSMILGLIIYGIYNGTNLVTINSYKLNVAIIDTLWGIVLFSLCTYLIYLIF
jgi:uncharacterized membrane protein